MRTALCRLRPHVAEVGVRRVVMTSAALDSQHALAAFTSVTLSSRRSACAVPLRSQHRHDTSGFFVACSLSSRRGYGTTPTTTTGEAPEVSDDASDLLWSSLEAFETPSTNPTASAPSPSPSTSSTSSTPSATTAARRPEGEREEGGEHNEGGGSANGAPSSSSSSSSAQDYVWVALHNMPRNWLHEDIIEFIHHVAQHAGITAPAASSAAHAQESANERGAEPSDDANDDEEGDGVMTSRVTSPFVHHLHIPFGRRTGLVYGSPKLFLSSARLATYLTKELTFDADDFRSRIYFTKLTANELPISFQQQVGGDDEAGGSNGFARVRYTPIEETVEHEQDDALRTLELDRYLFAPDLLLDIAKSHQRRLVTRNEKVLLDAFVDGEEDADGDEADDAEGDDAEDELHQEEGVEGTQQGKKAPRHTSTSSRRRRRAAGGGRKATHVRAGTQKHLGRGSMHNMPIPKPYVEGRQL